MITIDFLDLDSRQAWVELPVNPSEPSQGSARFLLQDVTYAKWQSIIMEIVTAGEAMAKALDALHQDGSEQATAAFGQSLARVLRAQTQAVRWGVAGHQDIANSSGEIAFESETVTFDGVTYKVASAKMLKLYTLIGRDKQGGSTLLAQLSGAIRRHQAGEEQPSLEALWTSASSKE